MFTRMTIRRLALPTLCIAVLALAGVAEAAPAGKGDNIADFDGPKEEQWLVQAIYDELRSNVGPENREALSKRLEVIAAAWLASGRMANMDTGSEIVHALRACKYLGGLEGKSKSANAGLAQWLLDNAEVRRLLFRALADVEKPEEAIARFAELQSAEPAKVVEYPNLAVAFATSNTLRYHKDQPKPETMVASFKYYADPKRTFRYDLKKMPYELSRYLADTRLSIDERNWAVKRYFRAADLGPVYFDVRYDIDHFTKKVPKKIDALDYTLGNLLKVGGVCIEQAYYASEVSKACGIPAAIVYGQGESGIGHAWFTYFQLNPTGTSASWSGGAGRYKEHLYFSGDVFNPATSKRILDTDLVLLGAAALLPLSRREQAEAAASLAELAAQISRDGEVAGDIEPLKTLAAEYQARQDKAEKSTAPKVMLDWVKPKQKIDKTMLEELLYLAIQKNITYSPTWKTIVALRKEGRLTTKSLDRYFTMLIGKTAEAFPEQSCKMILELVPTIEEADKRDSAYKKSLVVYGKRLDLRGRILIAMGDDVRERGLASRASLIYQAAATECVVVPDVVLPAAAKAEELMSSGNKKGEALRMYQMLFSKTTKSANAAPEIRQQTSNYKLGKRVADLLRQAGNTVAADQIMSKL